MLHLDPVDPPPETPEPWLIDWMRQIKERPEPQPRPQLPVPNPGQEPLPRADPVPATSLRA